MEDAFQKEYINTTGNINEQSVSTDDLKILIQKQKSSLNYFEKTGGFTSKPNWPPIFPIFHYDVDEVSNDIHFLLDEAFFCWKTFFFSLILNTICCITTMNLPSLVNVYETNLFISILYILILPVFFFKIANISIFEMFLIPYNSFTHRRTLLFVFLCCFLSFFFSLGIRFSGSNGIITCIDLFLERKKFASLFSAFSTSTFLISFLLYFRLFIHLFLLDLKE